MVVSDTTWFYIDSHHSVYNGLVAIILFCISIQVYKIFGFHLGEHTFIFYTYVCVCVCVCVLRGLVMSDSLCPYGL